MSVRPQLSQRGAWIFDARGQGRGVRASLHPTEEVINLSVWRDSVCVGTAHLGAQEAAQLISSLSDQLVELGRAAGPRRDAARVEALEQRLAVLEQAAAVPAWWKRLNRLAGRRRPPAAGVPVVPGPALRLVP